MSIINAFTHGDHQKNLGHFASIVKMALVDGVITEGEEKFLKRKARSLNMTDEEVKEILKNPDKYPINPPVGYDESITRLYRLTQMLYADDTPSKEEVNFLKRIIVGLGFPVKNIDKVASEAVHLVMNNNDLDDFAEAIKTVNSDLYE